MNLPLSSRGAVLAPALREDILTHPSLGQQPIGSSAPKMHVLKPTPKTVMWGYYDSASKPVLTIRSGETVQVQTLLAGTPEVVERSLLPAEEVEPALRDIVNHVKDKGPAGHILTGPIYIEGAEPGDTLEVRIKEIKLAIPYG
jgi:acetamidase/formamidase